MHYVYILRSDKRKLCYIGSTSNLAKRLKEHNNGDSRFTKTGIPWSLVYYEAFMVKRDSLIEERFLKTGAGRERLKKVLPRFYGGFA